MPSTPTPDEIAERLSEAILAPLRAVGALLAVEVDEIKRRLSELEAQVDRDGS